MSNFVPDNYGPQTSAQTLVDTYPSLPTSDVTSNSDYQTAVRLLTALGQNPQGIPQSIMGYLVDFIGVNQPTIPISQVVGYKAQSAITGTIPAAGNTATAGTGFTYTHTNGTGIYIFTFTTTFPAPPIVLVQCNAGSGNRITADVTSVTASGFTVVFRNSPDPNTVGDIPFAFIAQAVL